MNTLELMLEYSADEACTIVADYVSCYVCGYSIVALIKSYIVTVHELDIEMLHRSVY